MLFFKGRITAQLFDVSVVDMTDLLRVVFVSGFSP